VKASFNKPILEVYKSNLYKSTESDIIILITE